MLIISFILFTCTFEFGEDTVLEKFDAGHYEGLKGNPFTLNSEQKESVKF